MTPERRKELRFRLAFGVVGLLLTATTVLSQGWPPPARMAEAGIIGGLFFGGTILWSLRALQRGD